MLDNNSLLFIEGGEKMVNAVLQAIDYLLLGLAVAGLLAIGAAIDFWVIASCRLTQVEREKRRFFSRVGKKR